jgi:L-serine dehydratase
LLGGVPDEAIIELYNSFATTGEGHCTSTAITAGLLGMSPRAPRTREAAALAAAQAMVFRFHKVIDSREHPNTAVLNLRRGGRICNLKVISIGGGNWTMLSCQKQEESRAA